MPGPFVPGVTDKGKPCKSCIRLGELCHDHSGIEVQRGRRARTAAWRSTYLEYLRRGYSKRAAAGKAGVSQQTVFKHQREDDDFKEEVEIAYEVGTARLEEAADARIMDEEHPSDKILIHMLNYRGISGTRKHQHEHTGPDGGPIQTQSTFPFEKLSPQLQQAIVLELEAIARGEDPPALPPSELEPPPVIEGEFSEVDDESE